MTTRSPPDTISTSSSNSEDDTDDTDFTDSTDSDAEYDDDQYCHVAQKPEIIDGILDAMKLA